MQKYKAIVNNDTELDQIDFDQVDIIATGEKTFQIIDENVSYHFEIIHANYEEKSFLLKTNGNHYEVKLQDQYDQLVKKLGLSLGASQKIKEIKAPMPGLVLEILSTNGQTIHKGDPLLILEAMKMENIIKSPGEGVIRMIQVDKGAIVDKGQVLIEME